MKKSIRIITLLLVISLFATFFAGCGSSSGDKQTEVTQNASSTPAEQQQSSKTSTEAAKITVCTQSSQWADAFKKLMPEFEAANNAKVEFVDIAFGVMYENLMTKFMAGSDVYDLVWHDSMWLPEFVKKGFMEDLTPKLADKNLFPENFGYPDDFYGVEYSGKYEKGNQWGLPEGIWGIPLIAGWNPLYYRTDILKEAGFVDANGEAKPPETIDELIQVAQKVSNPSKDLYGYVMSGDRSRINYDWCGFLWTFGGDYFDKDMKPIFNSPEGVKALEAYIALAKTASPGAASYSISDCWTAFMQGKAALAWTWQDLASAVVDPSLSAYGKFKAAIPPAVNGARHPLVGGIVASIPKQAKSKDIAAKIIAWILSPENSIKDVQTGAYINRKSTYDLPEIEKIAPSAIGNIEKVCMEEGRAIPFIPEWSKVDQAIATQLSAALAGNKAPKAALDEAVKQVDQIMKDAGYYK